MAIFHCQAKAISRGAGRSATAAAAYRSGEIIEDFRTGEVHDTAENKVSAIRGDKPFRTLEYRRSRREKKRCQKASQRGVCLLSEVKGQPPVSALLHREVQEVEYRPFLLSRWPDVSSSSGAHLHRCPSAGRPCR